MVLISNRKQMFRKAGSHVYYDMYGNGFFSSSLKSIGRFLAKTGKNFYAAAKPKMISFAKNTFKEIKPKIQKSLTEATTKILDTAINKPKELKAASKQAFSELKDDLKTNIPIVKENVQKTYRQLLSGEGIQGRLNKRSKMIMNQLLSNSKNFR